MATTEDLEDTLHDMVLSTTREAQYRSDYDVWVRYRVHQEDYQEGYLRNLQRLVPDLQGKTVVDLGSGMGGFVVHLNRSGVRAVGVELSLDNCRITRLRALRHGLDGAVVNGQVESLPVRDRSVDVVMCNEVIEHVFDPDRLLVELRRVLRDDDSVVLMSAPNRWALYDSHYHLWAVNLLPRRLGDRVVTRLGRDKTDRSHGLQRLSEMHYYSWRRFLDACQRAGLAVVDLREEKLRAKERGTGRLAAAAEAASAVGLALPIYRLYRRTVMNSYAVVLKRGGVSP